MTVTDTDTEVTDVDAVDRVELTEVVARADAVARALITEEETETVVDNTVNLKEEEAVILTQEQGDRRAPC